MHLGFPRTFDLECGIGSATLLVVNRVWRMLIENVWYKMTARLDDCSERARLTKSFNEKSKDSFARGVTPTVLKASSSRRVTRNRHITTKIDNGLVAMPYVHVLRSQLVKHGMCFFKSSEV